jgi:hypothetical protein
MNAQEINFLEKLNSPVVFDLWNKSIAQISISLPSFDLDCAYCFPEEKCQHAYMLN